MTTRQPPEPMDTTPRDPHLPPPAVVDWLLDQNWSAPIPEAVTTYPEGRLMGLSGSASYQCREVTVAIGADEIGCFRVAEEAFDALLRDRLKRSDAYGIAYTALLQIKRAQDIQAVRKIAGDSLDCIRASGRQP
jgi:hypothetical protein